MLLFKIQMLEPTAAQNYHKSLYASAGSPPATHLFAVRANAVLMLN